MRLHVRDAVTRPSHVVNEDSWVGVEDAIWVMDGASGLSPDRVTDGPSDAAWLVERARAVIGRQDASGLVDTLATVVRDIAAALSASGDSPAHELPSASLVAVTLDGPTLEVLALGDCRLILRSPGGRARVIDDAETLDALDRSAIEALVAAQRSTGADLDVARESIRDLLRRNRDLLNRPGGYRALAPGLEVTEVALRRVPVGTGTTGLLVSDGFYRLVDTFHVLDPDGLMDAVTVSGVGPLLDELRRLETNDPEAQRFPRLKRSDDATAVAFEVVEDGQ